MGIVTIACPACNKRYMTTRAACPFCAEPHPSVPPSSKEDEPAALPTTGSPFRDPAPVPPPSVRGAGVAPEQARHPLVTIAFVIAFGALAILTTVSLLELDGDRVFHSGAPSLLAPSILLGIVMAVVTARLGVAVMPRRPGDPPRTARSRTIRSAVPLCLVTCLAAHPIAVRLNRAGIADRAISVECWVSPGRYATKNGRGQGRAFTRYECELPDGAAHAEELTTNVAGKRPIRVARGRLGAWTLVP